LAAIALVAAPLVAAEKSSRRVKSRAPAAKPLLKKSELCAVVPDYGNTPDGMCLLPDGNIIVSVPNVNDQSQPGFLMKLTTENKLELFYPCPLHPDTNRAYPFGICVGPSGDLYYADLQWFADPAKPNYKSRVMRIPMKDGKPGKAVTVVSGMVVANAVAIRDGYLYVSDTMMVPDSKPLISGVYRMRLDEEGLVLKRPLEKESHLIATVQSFNEKIPFGADGLTLNSQGHLYIGNFADGTLHEVKFDAQGKPGPCTIFAKAPFMKSCDGIFCDVKTDRIYVADSQANAVQVVEPTGAVWTLAQDADNDGTTGRLDQPCEVLFRGREMIISNFDMPVEGGVNKKFEVPNTICKIRMD
jgi:sugar lactone lactonase YvrE